MDSTQHPPGTASRRTLLGGAAAAGAAFTFARRAEADEADAPARRRGQRSMVGVPYERHASVRVGIIGLGNRGASMAPLWAAVPGCTVRAVCDVRKDRATKVARELVADGHQRPVALGGSESSYLDLVKRDDIDFVYIATPWEFHYEQARAGLEHGKHVGVELPIATELHELWSLVDTSEREKKHLLLMENCNYDRNETAMIRMAHEGLLGDITSGAGGYLHDLRELLFSDTYYTDAWRRLWHTRSTASFYPMHGLAPISNCMDINRGDRYVTLEATATPAKGLAEYRERHMPKGHASWDETYINGDRITCMINTHQGRMIRAEHAVSSPMPYSRINTLEGSLGIIEDYPSRIYFEPEHSGHQWRDFKPFGEKWEHWLWRKVGDDASANGGHGGMDYIMCWRIVQQMRTGQVPDWDVYDSAAWCAPVPLSVTSLKKQKAVRVPDFTRGEWKKSRPGVDSKESDMPV